MQVRVFVIIEGGSITNVLADDPDVVDVVVVDYDVDGLPLDETTMMPQVVAGEVDGEEPAAVSRWGNDAIEQVGEILYHKAIKMFGDGG